MFALAAAISVTGVQIHAGVQSAREATREEMTEPLYASIRALDAAGIREAIKAGADPNGQRNPPRTPPLLIVAAVGFFGTDATKALDADDLELSLIAAYTALLDGGASLSASWSVMMMHAERGHAKVIEFLISKGADPNQDGGIGETPLIKATYFGQASVAEVLHKAGVAPYSDEMVRQIRLMSAVEAGDLLRVRRLIIQGADVNQTDPAGRRSLAWAIRQGAKQVEAMVQLLLDAGANPNQTGKSIHWGMETPLHVAVEAHGEAAFRDTAVNEAVIAALLAAGAHVSSVEGSWARRTPLHIAAEKSNVGAARLLLEAGAKVMPRDRYNRTPLDLAESGEMIRLLKSYGATEN
jgi:ankyrin repeat protein